MTSLPSGLASISARLDDTPQVRGAVAFGRMVREREEAKPWCLAGTRGLATDPKLLATLGSVIDRHAQLAVSAAYKGRDLR